MGIFLTRETWFYGILTLVLWPFPLVGVLHVESCAIIAFVGFYVSGWRAFRDFSTKTSFLSVLFRQLVLLLIPLAGGLLSMLWRSNCGWLDGLLFFVLFPVISVVFGVSLAWAITGFQVKRPFGAYVLVSLIPLLGGLVFDLGFHPQFYTYNHVFGGVLGPIYDEELAIRTGLYVFRLFTLLWSGAFWILGQSKRKGTSFYGKLAVVGLLLFMGYLFRDVLGFNTTHAAIATALKGIYHTPHFEIYYDPSEISAARIKIVAKEHEFRYMQFAETLKVQVPTKIRSYLYPTPEKKAQLTGARYTNVAPVWLSQPQIHVLWSSYEGVMPHELAHVFSREFALPVLRATFSVGLIEGFAVAVEPPEGVPEAHDQVAAILLDPQTSRWLGDDLSLAVAEKLSPTGFWRGRGAVSYTTMGSFVRFLIDRYGITKMKQVYAWGNFEKVYQKNVYDLTREWMAFLQKRAASGAVLAFARTRFSRPSLFEQTCPHFLPNYVKLTTQAQHALLAKDHPMAIRLSEQAIQKRVGYEPAYQIWSAASLPDSPEKVLEKLKPLQYATWLTYRQRGDAYALLGDTLRARKMWNEALVRIPPFSFATQTRMARRTDFLRFPHLLKSVLSQKTTPETITQLFEQNLTAPLWLRVYVADRYAEEEHWKEAATWLESVVTAEPSGLFRDVATLDLGRCLLWSGQVQKAIMLLQPYAEKPAENPIQKQLQDLKLQADWWP